jgi:hypothetical protein
MLTTADQFINILANEHIITLANYHIITLIHEAPPQPEPDPEAGVGRLGGYEIEFVEFEAFRGVQRIQVLQPEKA